jgi:hypothetical protein
MSEEDEKIRAYLTSFRAFQAATRKAGEVAKKALREAEKLKSWRRAAEATGVNGDGKIESGDLQGIEVRDVFQAWWRARKELFAVWGDIREGDREGLIPPENADPGAAEPAT